MRLLMIMLALCISCAGSSTELPPVDETFLSAEGKADGFGVDDDSPEGVGILRLVNAATEYDLDVRAELNSIAATNIIEERELAGSIDTLEQLDDVPYVGIAAFRSLYRFAQNQGYFDTLIYGVEERSAVALAILDLVNTASATVLDDVVGLYSRAADNIVAERQDGAIESLSQLDAIPYVGESAFDALRDYVSSPLDQDTIDTFLSDMAGDIGEYFHYEANGYEDNVEPVSIYSLTQEVDAAAQSNIETAKEEWENNNPGEYFNASVGEAFRVSTEGANVGFVVRIEHDIDHPFFDGAGTHLYINLLGEVVADVPWAG